jgi:nucleoside-diphosphate-sugar epimerase
MSKFKLDPESVENLGVVAQDIVKLIHDQEINLLKLKNSSVLVTGASGHLGFYFLLILLECNYLFDLNLNITSSSKGPLNKVFDRYHDNLTQLIGDLTAENFLETFKTYDFIIHLAGYAQPTKFIQDPLSTITLNTVSLSKLINKIKKGGKFLYLSSSEVYTNSNFRSTTEDAIGSVSVNHPRAGYILSKKLGEVICLNSNRYSGTQIKIARLATTYGPGIKIGDTRAISQFFAQALKQKKITLVDNGSAIREYIYVADAVSALLNILIIGESDIYNIGAGKFGRTTILEMAKKIATLTSAELCFSNIDSKKLSAQKIVNLDVGKYETEFGATAKQEVLSGLSKTINWLVEQEFH